jgi:hypothetical protein
MNQFYTCDLCGSTILENGIVIDSNGKYPCLYCRQELSVEDRMHAVEQRAQEWDRARKS